MILLENRYFHISKTTLSLPIQHFANMRPQKKKKGFLVSLYNNQRASGTQKLSKDLQTNYLPIPIRLQMSKVPILSIFIKQN